MGISIYLTWNFFFVCVYFYRVNQLEPLSRIFCRSNPVECMREKKINYKLNNKKCDIEVDEEEIKKQTIFMKWKKEKRILVSISNSIQNAPYTQ